MEYLNNNRGRIFIVNNTLPDYIAQIKAEDHHMAEIKCALMSTGYAYACHCMSYRVEEQISSISELSI